MADHALALRTHTDRLVHTAGTLTDPGAPSLCDGWTRGHVLTHLARNAEAVGRLADWAVTGTPQAMYPGGTAARDAQIDQGAGRPVEELRQDLVTTAQALEPRLAALAGRLASPQVEMRGGLEVEATQLPFLRLREVVLHHADLAAGFTLAEVEEQLLRELVDDAVTRLKRSAGAPGLELVAEEGDRWTVGDGLSRVEGPLAGLLLWLARSRTEGIRSGGAPPELPRGA